MIPYFVCAALLSFGAAFLLSLAASLHPAAHVHLALAVGMMPLIFSAIGYFVPVLTRSAQAPRALAAVPAVAQAAGVLLVLVLATVGHAPMAFALPALLALAAAVGLTAWIRLRARHMLGRPHPGLAWYLAALGCLAAALLAIPAMAVWPEHYVALKRWHLHLNLLGFIGLTALGTLQVLLPTAAGRFDPDAALRLQGGLKWALAGSLLVAAGAAVFAPLAWLGLALWLVALFPVARAWTGGYRDAIFAWHGAAPSLGAALAGFVLSLLAGAVVGARSPAAVAHAFMVAFLFPLVMGAASQLLPVWLRPGRQDEWHGAVRRGLTRGGGARAALCLAAGALVALGLSAGFALAVLALAAFGAQAIATLRSAQNN